MDSIKSIEDVDSQTEITTELTPNISETDPKDQQMIFETKPINHEWTHFHDVISLQNFYTQLNSEVILERDIIPGTITFLMFAKQLKDAQFETSISEILRSGSTKLYNLTLGQRFKEWSSWIYEIKYVKYSDLHHPNYIITNGEHKQEFSRKQNDREITPEEQRQFIENNLTDPVKIKSSIPTKERSIHEENSDQESTILHSNYEDEAIDETSINELYIDDRMPSPVYSNYRSAGYYADTPGSIQMHERSREVNLSKLHQTVQIPAIFSDLYLNLLNTLYNEYVNLSKTFNSVTRLDDFGDDEDLKVFKVLLIYARSTQPPFRQPSNHNVPVLHLELFFNSLISKDKIIKDVRIYLKHYIQDEQLNADRYSAIIQNAFSTRNKLFQSQGIRI